MDYSSGIIKPDGLARNLSNEIFKWMESSGLKVIFSKLIYLTEKDVKVLYEYCYSSDHYGSLLEFLLSGPVIFYIVTAENDAIGSLNRLVGSTDPSQALKETIRGKYGESVARNVIHSTQNATTFKRDIGHFLTKGEMLKIFLNY